MGRKGCGFSGTSIKDSCRKLVWGVETGDGGPDGWGGRVGWGEKAENCT